MAKTFSEADFGSGAASRAIQEAQKGPVLVSRESRPAAWILSADRLAQVATARGPAAADAYQCALELLAVELYREATLTLGQGATLAGMSLADFIDLCDNLGVPILWPPEGGIEAEVDRLESVLRPAELTD